MSSIRQNKYLCASCGEGFTRVNEFRSHNCIKTMNYKAVEKILLDLLQLTKNEIVINK